jgi:hypothetical protein
VREGFWEEWRSLRKSCFSTESTGLPEIRTLTALLFPNGFSESGNRSGELKHVRTSLVFVVFIFALDLLSVLRRAAQGRNFAPVEFSASRTAKKIHARVPPRVQQPLTKTQGVTTMVAWNWKMHALSRLQAGAQWRLSVTDA